MPIDDLTALGQKMREARKNKELTQQELSDLSHVSVKQIANIEKGKMNPSYLIFQYDPKLSHKNRKTPGRHEAIRTHEIELSFT